MKTLNITGRINAKALELLDQHPEGLHTIGLCRMIEASDPTLHPKTINGTVWKLTQKYPDKISKKDGIFYLVKHNKQK